MPTLTEIAKALGIDKSLASRYAKRQMPLTSVQAARAWKAENIRPRVRSFLDPEPADSDDEEGDDEEGDDEEGDTLSWQDAFVTVMMFARRDLERYLPAAWHLYINGVYENRKRILDPHGEVPAETWKAFDAYCASVNCTWRPR